MWEVCRWVAGAVLAAGVLFPVAAEAEMWIAWVRQSYEDSSGSLATGWTVVSSYDPFQSPEACQSAFRNIVGRLAAEARKVPVTTDANGDRVQLIEARLSANGLRAEIERSRASKSDQLSVETFIVEYKCWPVGVNPR